MTARDPGGNGLDALDGLGALADSQRTRTRHRRPVRLLVGVAGLGALALLLSQAGRLPGPAGDAIRENTAADRDATALFYTEVDGWPTWPERDVTPLKSAAARSRASRSPTSTAVSPGR